MSHIDNCRALALSRFTALGARPPWWRPLRRRRYDRAERSVLIDLAMIAAVVNAMVQAKEGIQKLMGSVAPAPLGEAVN